MNLHDRDIIRAAKKEAIYETAMNLLKMGLSMEQVVQGTGLSLEEVENLKKQDQ